MDHSRDFRSGAHLVFGGEVGEEIGGRGEFRISWLVGGRHGQVLSGI